MGSGTETGQKAVCGCCIFHAGEQQVEGQGLCCLHADSVVCVLSSFIFFYFLSPIQKWEEWAVSAAIDENQTPNVWWQAAISRSAVFVFNRNLVSCFCWQCLAILK